MTDRPETPTPTPLLLALDTATRRATAAICRRDAVLAEGAREVTTHSEGLMPLVDELLHQAGATARELDAVVCGRGPGSFTGLRIGMATAKGLCLATGRPLLCCSSLESLARGLEEQSVFGRSAPARGAPAALPPAPIVAAVVDARRGEVYLGLFRRGAPQGDEVVCTPGELSLRLPPGEPVVLVGDGAVAYRDQLLDALGDRATLAPESCHVIEARHLAQIALPRYLAGEVDELATAVPLYIRASDARLPAIPQDRRGKV